MINNKPFLVLLLSLTDPVKHRLNLQKQITPEAKSILQVIIIPKYYIYS